MFLVAEKSLAETANPPAGKHFLWRVTNAGAPFYLIGSLHAVRGSDYPLPPEIERAFNGAERAFFEMDPGAADAPLLRQKLARAGHYPRGITIEKTLSPQTLAYLKQIAQVTESEYLDRKPWAIAYFMVQYPGDLRAFSTRLSMDRYLYGKARGRMKIAGLETTDEFVNSLTRLSDRANEAFLVDAMAYARRSPELLAGTIAAWKQGDTERMYRLYARRGSGANGYCHWLEQRQIGWLPRIEEAIRSGQPAVVVVGALHFCGPRSLPAMLRARGYQVEQL